MATHVRLVAIGTRGDVQPYVALGLGLHAAGYQVSIATTNDFVGFVSSFGLDVVASPFDLRRSLATRANRGSGRRARRALFDDMLEHLVPLCQGADLVLYSPATSLIMPDVLEFLQIDGVPAFLQPFAHPTGELPVIMMPRLPFGRWSNRLSYRLLDRLLWLSLGRKLNRWRQTQLGLPPTGDSPLQRIQTSSVPALYGISPAVLPRPADWDASIHLTGYWFLPPAASYTPPPALETFLATEPAPIFAGFGSMGGPDHTATMRAVLAAIVSSGRRAIIGSGWGGATAGDLPDSVLVVSDVPYEWLFPRVAAVIHHGGAGTTAEGLRAGKPTIVIPTGGDQPFWGERVAALGVGPPPIPRSRLSAPRLLPALDQVLTDRAMQAAATRLGERIRSEDGVANAVHVLRSFRPPDSVEPD